MSLVIYSLFLFSNNPYCFHDICTLEFVRNFEIKIYFQTVISTGYFSSFNNFPPALHVCSENDEMLKEGKLLKELKHSVEFTVLRENFYLKKCIQNSKF